MKNQSKSHVKNHLSRLTVLSTLTLALASNVWACPMDAFNPKFILLLISSSPSLTTAGVAGTVSDSLKDASDRRHEKKQKRLLAIQEMTQVQGDAEEYIATEGKTTSPLLQAKLNIYAPEWAKHNPGQSQATCPLMVEDFLQNLRDNAKGATTHEEIARAIVDQAEAK